MGQAKRRKRKIDQLKATSANCRSAARGVSEDAIHEAGHAVARFMTAELWGYEPQDTVAYIEMCRPSSAPIVGETATMEFKAVARGTQPT